MSGKDVASFGCFGVACAIALFLLFGVVAAAGILLAPFVIVIVALFLL